MIFVECNPDRLLVSRLTGLPRREIVHELKGKYEICKRLSAELGRSALLDEDPTAEQPRYLRAVPVVGELDNVALRVLNDEQRGNRVVILRPRLEEWILGAAREGRLDVSIYKLPTTANQLHKVINVNIGNFERLVDALIAANPPSYSGFEAAAHRKKAEESAPYTMRGNTLPGRGPPRSCLAR